MIEEIDLPEQNYGPGNVLRAKREEYEWSVEAVAEALHLSTNSVKAIEADRYDDLPGATYVIGYWRSYARLLGIDIEDTIEANKPNLNIVVPETSGIDVNQAYYQKKSGGFLWLLLLLAAIGGFAYYAWQQQFFGLLDDVPLFQSEQNVSSIDSGMSGDRIQEEPVIQETEVLRPLNQENAQVVVDTQVATPADTEPNFQPGTLAEGESGQQITNSILRPLENGQPSSNTSQTNLQQGLILPSNNDGQASTAAVSNSNNVLQSQAMNIATTEPVTVDNSGTLASNSSEASVLQQVSEDATPVDETIMILNLTKDSWLDVRDKTNKRLLYRTETAGKEIKVKGTPPFYVYIGTPSGVTIRYKGKDVPFETHKSGLFARFKLDDTVESL